MGPGICFLLSQVGHHAATTFAEEIKPLGLQPAHAGILRIVSKRPGLSQRELGEHLNIIPSRLVQLLDDLEEKGVIERRAAANDRRSHELHLTADGVLTMSHLAKAAQNADARLSSGLTDDERVMLTGLVHKLATTEGLLPDVHPGYAGRPKPV